MAYLPKPSKERDEILSESQVMKPHQVSQIEEYFNCSLHHFRGDGEYQFKFNDNSGRQLWIENNKIWLSYDKNGYVSDGTSIYFTIEEIDNLSMILRDKWNKKGNYVKRNKTN